MANEELYSALKAADAAGDIAGARKLAQYIQALPADGGVKAATSAPSKTLPSAGLMDKVNAYSGSPMDAIGGLVRGAGSIGATIAYPKDKITDMVQGDRGKNLSSLITGRELPSRNDERRQAMDDALQGLGADPNSKTYKGMKMLGEVAGTAGVGGVTAPVLNAIGAPLKVVNAARSAGMSVSSPGFVGAAAPAPVANAFARAAGGAVTGGASAGLVNPSDVPTGAAIGALAPGVIQGAGYAGGKIGGAVWDALTPEIQKRAVQLAQLTGKSLDEVISGLKQQGPSLIPGSGKTVPTILQDPNISQVGRTLLNQGEYGLRNREAQNNLARIAAVDRVAPTAGTVNEARENAGNAITAAARTGEKAASDNVTNLFSQVNPNEAMVNLPLDKMRALAESRTGPGYFGKGKAAVDSAINEANAIGTKRIPGAPIEYSSSDIAARPNAASGFGSSQTVARAVPFDELQRLRSSIGEAITEAQANKRGNAVSALTAIKNEIDNKVASVVGGTKEAGEVFTPSAVNAWGQALNAHAAKKLQFNTGQQAQIFRQGANGQPMVGGAQVAPLFWNGGNNQVRAIEDFQRLTGGDKTLTGLLKSNATTELLDQAKGAKGPLTPDGSLTANGVDKWMRNHSGAIENLFSQPEKSTLKAVQNEIGAVGAAENLGRATGSNTAQNLFSAGALDSPALKAAANGIKGVRLLTGPALEWVKNSSAANRNKLLSALLEDPELMAKTLQASKVRDEAGAKLAELLNSPQAKQMLYRAAPVAISGR